MVLIFLPQFYRPLPSSGKYGITVYKCSQMSGSKIERSDTPKIQEVIGTCLGISYPIQNTITYFFILSYHLPSSVSDVDSKKIHRQNSIRMLCFYQAAIRTSITHCNLFDFTTVTLLRERF